MQDISCRCRETHWFAPSSGKMAALRTRLRICGRIAFSLIVLLVPALMALCQTLPALRPDVTVPVGESDPKVVQQATEVSQETRAFLREMVSATPGTEKVIDQELIFDSYSAVDDSMRVIVTLESLGRTLDEVDWRSDEDRQNWRSEVSAMQEMVLEELDPSGCRVLQMSRGLWLFFQIAGGQVDDLVIFLQQLPVIIGLDNIIKHHDSCVL